MRKTIKLMKIMNEKTGKSPAKLSIERGLTLTEAIFDRASLATLSFSISIYLLGNPASINAAIFLSKACL